MIKPLLILLLSVVLFACSGTRGISSDGTTAPKASKAKELSEAEKVSFGRFYIEASTQKMLGNHEKAMELYSRALSIDPNFNLARVSKEALLSRKKGSE